MARAPCRRRTGEAQPRAEKFGDLITADHKVFNEGCESRDNHRYAVVRFMERTHKVYSVERETSKGIQVVWVETDKDSNDYQTRSCMARSLSKDW